MRKRTVILNIEANGLDPKEIWCATTIDIHSGEEREFRYPDRSDSTFPSYMDGVDCSIGHNILGYDAPVLERLVSSVRVERSRCIDTLVISRLLDFGRPSGHSLAAWAPDLGVVKTEQPPWDVFSEALVDHSLQNCRITLALYKHFLPWINSSRWKSPLRLEHDTAIFCSELNRNGFHFDIDKCTELRYNILKELDELDEQIIAAFPPRVVPVRTVTPKLTKFGTLNRSDFRFVKDGDLGAFNGGPFSLIRFEEFNPGSPSQIVERLNDAGWRPVEKTKGHVDAIRAKDTEKIDKMAKSGWKVSETNLATLPKDAPAAAHLLAKRITAASRTRTLKEWIDAYNPDTGRVHGSFNGIGAWTHRMSHNHPNTANIPTPQPLNPNSTSTAIWANGVDGKLRDLWGVPLGRWLVGVDAESIQLRILAHYINDNRFTKALIEGTKEACTDPHSLNKIALGSVCHSRAEAKTFIYAWLLGAGVGKVAEILGCSTAEAKQAIDNFIGFYPGLAYLKEHVIPSDAERGYFEGFDGRFVKIPGDDYGSRRHFTLAGYLQNGESTIMKRGVQIWRPKLIKERVPFWPVNFVHDEWQTETDTYDNGLIIANTQADSIRQVGIDLNLRCPMAGAILNGHGKIAIGHNWSETH